MTEERRYECSCVYVPVCAMMEAELLYNPEGTSLSFPQIQLRQIMVDGKYNRVSESIAGRETERKKQSKE